MTWYVEKGYNLDSGRKEWYVQDLPGVRGNIYVTCASRAVALACRRGFIQIGFLPYGVSNENQRL